LFFFGAIAIIMVISGVDSWWDVVYWLGFGGEIHVMLFAKRNGKISQYFL